MMTEKSFHEAGHAVAASVLGTPIKLASLNDGVTTVWWTGSDQARRNEAIIAMAGAAAEIRAMSYSADQCDELWKTVWAVDKENAKRRHGGTDTEHAMRQARWIVEDNWGSIEKVAAALEKHGTLTGEDVAVLLST
jgi:ornithine carbamoyltransferase